MPNEPSPSDVESKQPADCHGAPLSAFDIVRLLRLPDWGRLNADSDVTKAAFQDHKSCYGLVTYSRRPDRDGWRRWHGPDNHVFIEVVKITGLVVTAYGFVVPSSYVERLPYNAIIMNIFADFDWHSGWDTIFKAEDIQKWTPRLPEVIEEAVTSGTKAFEVIKAILETPYETLLAAHDEAAKIIGASQTTKSGSSSVSAARRMGAPDMDGAVPNDP